MRLFVCEINGKISKEHDEMVLIRNFSPNENFQWKFQRESNANLLCNASAARVKANNGQ